MTSPVPARISLVTLGVADVARSTAFYRALGWEPSGASVAGDVSFFRMAGAALGLYGAGDLAADAGFDRAAADRVPRDFRGFSVAMNLESREAVDGAFAAAQRAGATIVKAPVTAEWGGYSGYFADPDGHLWEVAHNPFWPLDDRGLPVLPS